MNSPKCVYKQNKLRTTKKQNISIPAKIFVKLEIYSKIMIIRNNMTIYFITIVSLWFYSKQNNTCFMIVYDLIFLCGSFRHQFINVILSLLDHRHCYVNNTFFFLIMLRYIKQVSKLF